MKSSHRFSSAHREHYYHCITRIVAGEHLLGNAEKAVFRSIMKKVAEFCGVDVLTYCIMSNHVHILCRVPPRDSTKISDEELMRRYRILFSEPSQYRPFKPEVLENLLQKNTPEGKEARENLLMRMHNISMFMKILKLRMSIWFNKTHRRFGTLWAEKFKSIVVEGRGNPLLRMAQYIDLNPVRAGMTTKAADYPFCGLGDALKGSSSSRRGIEKIAKLTSTTLLLAEAVEWYDHLLSVTLKMPTREAKPASEAITTSPPQSLLKRQLRFSNSLAVGSHAFLTNLIREFSAAFSRRIRVKGPCRHDLDENNELFFGRNERRSAT